MKSINEYKRRFNMLLESKMGDVKPLISEAPQFEEFVVPTMDMVLNYEVLSYNSQKMEDELPSELSLDGNEYKLTLPEGMYDPSEKIIVKFDIDPKIILKTVLGNDSRVTRSSNIREFSVEKNIENESSNKFKTVILVFNMPETQKELEEKSPYIAYIETPCKNVRGGKIKFSAEVPSGSEIYEGSRPVPTPTPNENYKPVPTPTYNPNY